MVWYFVIPHSQWPLTCWILVQETFHYEKFSRRAGTTISCCGKIWLGASNRNIWAWEIVAQRWITDISSKFSYRNIWAWEIGLQTAVTWVATQVTLKPGFWPTCEPPKKQFLAAYYSKIIIYTYMHSFITMLIYLSIHFFKWCKCTAILDWIFSLQDWNNYTITVKTVSEKC